MTPDLQGLIELAKAKGTYEEYRAFIQRQPSCRSGLFSEYFEGQGRCVAAHVRRAGESGIAYKGNWALVPLTASEHNLQHQKGESALGGKEFFDEQRVKYLELWLEI